MFTHNIRNIVIIGKSAMKWKNHNDTQKALEDLNRDDSVADLLKKAELATEEIQRFQGENFPDAIKIDGAVEGLAKILAKIDPKNSADRQAVLKMLDSQVKEAPENSDSKQALTALQQKFVDAYLILDQKNEADKSEVQETTKVASTRIFESVIQKNSRDIQARDFTEYVASKLKGELREQFLEAVTKKDSMGNTTYELTKVSIPNLIRSVTEGTVYVADGAEWNDRYALGKFMEVYSANTDVFNTILKPLAIAANAGQSVESMRKSGKLKDNADNSEIIQYLAKVDNFETQGTTALDRQLSAATVFLLDSFKGDDKKFLDVLSKAAKLGGYEGTVDKASITTNPSLKYSILAGIRQASRLPGGIDSLRDAKSASGIGENERKVLETLDASKTKLLDGLKDGFQKQLANQIKDGTIDAGQANEAQKAIDAYIADMKVEGSPGWNIISKNFGAAITNRGAGAAVGATMNFPQNWLADNVSLGIGFSTGKPGVGVGITFDKSVTQDTKILYGWAGVPFVGMTTQFDKWHFTGIGGIGGGLLNVSRDMGNKDLEVKNIEGIKSANKILSQIERLATVDKKAKAIIFEQDVSSYPESSNNPMEPTQSRVTALNTAINTDIQNRLSVAGFDSENNTVVRSQMIYNALKQAIQSRIDLLHMDDATGGWSLKSLGLTLGSFAGLPFILPSISFGRTSYTQSVKLEKNQDRQVSTPITTATRGTSGIEETQTKFDSLEKVESLNMLLTKKETRIALSHLWNNPSRKIQVNAFAEKLQSFQMEKATIDECKTAFISLTKGLGELSSLSRIVSGISDPRELQSALFDIRGAMMMDENQARTLTTQGGLTVNESPAATRKRFDEILVSQKISPLLEKMGLTGNDFASVANGVGDNNSALTLTEPKTRLVGAVASLKTSTPRMDIMPAGTMRFAKTDAREFIKDASKFDESKRSNMYDVILPVGSLSERYLRMNIATALQQTEPISSKELKDLMITGKVNIGGKEVSMTGQKFYLGAYGDCTNPCIALEPGKISVPGTPGVPVTADEPAYNLSTGSHADFIGLTGALGYAVERHKDKPKEEPKKKEEEKKEEPKPSVSTNPQNGTPQDMGKVSTNSQSGTAIEGTTHAQGSASSAANTTPSGTLTLGSSPTGVQPRDTTITPAPVKVDGTRTR